MISASVVFVAFGVNLRAEMVRISAGGVQKLPSKTLMISPRVPRMGLPFRLPQLNFRQTKRFLDTVFSIFALARDVDCAGLDVPSCLIPGMENTGGRLEWPRDCHLQYGYEEKENQEMDKTFHSGVSAKVVKVLLEVSVIFSDDHFSILFPCAFLWPGCV